MDLTGLGSVAELAKDMVDRFFPKAMDEAEKAAIQVKMTEAIQAREASVISSQKDIMVAEMNQSDNFTKRARPSIVYFGLAAIGLNHVILPWVAWFMVEILGKTSKLPVIGLPEEFWYTWGGVCSIWIWGRSKEKMGTRDKMISMITGGK
jgi:hypothetical protein